MASVLLCFSGGIDSSMAALRLKSQGYTVTGLYINMLNISDDELIKIKDAASLIDLELIIFDAINLFNNKVVDYFVGEYMNGHTPSPCVLCNPSIKWNIVEKVADENNIEYISSGHYIQTVLHNDKFYIKKGVDSVKDQSFYLWGLSFKTISRIVPILGKTTKDETRELAKQHNLHTLSKQKESMGVCFLQNRDYRDFLEQDPSVQMPGAGYVKHKDGTILGKHDGFPFYTIGQKRGLHLNDKTLCVTEIDAKNNTLIIGDTKDLYICSFNIHKYKFSDINEAMSTDKLVVLVRGIGRNPTNPCKLSFHDDSITVTLTDPAWAIAPGQAVAFYIDDRLVGGGICK